MTITIRLTKVEVEMLKELQKRDKRYKKGLEEKERSDLSADYKVDVEQLRCSGLAMKSSRSLICCVAQCFCSDKAVV